MLAIRPMEHIILAAGDKYQGSNEVQLDKIVIHEEKEKYYLERDEQYFSQVYNKHWDDIVQVAGQPIVQVSQKIYAEAIHRSQDRQGELETGRSGEKRLYFRSGDLVCLDGQHRIKAAIGHARNGGHSTWWPVHILLDGRSRRLVQ